nr:nudix hydrolase 20, chloroplastic isoform X2 [Bactrocera oleae]
MASTDINVKLSRLYHLAQKFNNFYLTGFQKGDIRPFLVEGEQVGLVKADVIKQLQRYPEIFCIRNCEFTKQGIVELNPAFRDYAERTKQVDIVLRDLRSKGIFSALQGWRDEYYEVKSEYRSLLKMDRSATPLFGVRKYGVDINGYVQHPTQGLCIWLQQRSNTKETWPGKWDNMVGGGLSVGYGIKETAIKEAAEEASIPSDLVKNLVSAELPLDFVPQNADGEVQAFELLPAKECVERVFTQDFKTTSCPVVIDFLIRHGYITPENEVHFTQIIELLHVPLQSLYTYKSVLEQKQKLKQQNQSQQQSHLANNIKTIENGHNNKDATINN